jgi:protoporphyrinogen oxidase
VVDPLVGGIYTADPDRLSIHATLPRFPALERRHRSVILGLRATTTGAARRAVGARYGFFATHRDGMGAFAAAITDDTLARRVRADLAALAGITAIPSLVRVHRWERAMPQYVVGHMAHVAAIEARVARLAGLALAGAAYRGVGIPDCIRSGEAAADRLVAQGT